jgi:hypothetical protein
LNIELKYSALQDCISFNIKKCHEVKSSIKESNFIFHVF